MRYQTRAYWVACAAFLALLASVQLGCESRSVEPPKQAPAGLVTVVIETDTENVETIELEDIADGTSLETVMRSIENPGIEISGSGTTAFVNSIGETSTDSSQGWTFTVDGEFANQGIGKTTLHPPTTVKWTYGEFEM